MASTRRLAAIMFTDMVGSTAAAQVNEAEALRLRDEQEQLVRPLFAAHQGREIKSMGDGFLAEFDSALRAVQCAIDIQQRIHERNSQPGQSPIQLRVGIHLGDVETRGTDIFGDSVNVASRVEPLAEPGGICVTEPVFGQVQNKIPNPMEKLPPQVLKNVRFPIEVYKVTMPWDRSAGTSGALERHRVAVMPLVNMISDPSEEYFADGMTEELISAISKLRELDVISRTSVTQYKNTTKKVAEIGRDLGVGTLLEGSVRKAGNRVRIAVQLIDAHSDKHLWAESYDRTLDDVFSIQSEIAQSVASMLKVTLLEGDRKRLEKAPTKIPEAHALYLRGRAAQTTGGEKGLREAAKFYQMAVARDSQYALAYAWLAIAHLTMGFFELDPPLEAAREGGENARRALDLDPSLPEAHAAMAYALFLRWDFDGTEAELNRARELDPNFREALQYSSFVMRLRRRFKESEELARRALELDPLSRESIEGVATNLLYLGRPGEALALYRTVLEIDPNEASARGNLGLCYVQQGRFEEGLALIRESIRLSGGFGVGTVSDLAYALGKAGRLVELRALLAEGLEWYKTRGRGAIAVAAIYANLGEKDAAFEWLNKALDEHSAYLPTVVFDFAFEKLWSDPRMNAILDLLGLR